MTKLTAIAGICLTILAGPLSAQTGSIGGSTTSGPPDPSTTCMIQKSAAYYKRSDLAVALAQRIALECAELLPQHAENCPNNQAACDQIIQETNEQLTALMAKYAYRMIVELRQKNAAH